MKNTGPRLDHEGGRAGVLYVCTSYFVKKSGLLTLVLSDRGNREAADMIGEDQQ